MPDHEYLEGGVSDTLSGHKEVSFLSNTGQKHYNLSLQEYLLIRGTYFVASDTASLHQNSQITKNHLVHHSIHSNESPNENIPNEHTLPQYSPPIHTNKTHVNLMKDTGI